MASWDDAIKNQPSGALNKAERQGTRVVLDRFITRERVKGALRSYLWWLSVSVPIAIALARYFLDHGVVK